MKSHRTFLLAEDLGDEYPSSSMLFRYQLINCLLLGKSIDLREAKRNAATFGSTRWSSADLGEHQQSKAKLRRELQNSVEFSSV